MRLAQKEAVEHVMIRCDLTENQIVEISMLLASTLGPLIVSSLIENGLLQFRKIDSQKRKIKRSLKTGLKGFTKEITK